VTASITRIHACEILDSRGNPALEVEITLAGGDQAREVSRIRGQHWSRKNMKVSNIAAARCAVKTVILIGVVAGLAACGKSPEAVGSVAAKPLAFEAVDARVKTYMECAIPAARAKHLSARDYAEAAIRDAGFDALHRNAVEVAGARVARFEQVGAAPSTESGRAQGDLEAIVSAADDANVADGLRAKARAYEAYYQSLGVGEDCKLDADVLNLINKG